MVHSGLKGRVDAVNTKEVVSYMSNIIRPNEKSIVIPKHIIKEKLDEAHRTDWEDPERYLRQKLKALQYIPVRARELPDQDKLLSEIKRVFHDDLIGDLEIKEAIQLAVWTVDRQRREDERDGEPQPAGQPDPGVGPIKAGEKAPRGEVRGVDESDETLLDLEYQQHEHEIEP